MRILIALFLAAGLSPAATFYVANAGSDAANGMSTSTPWQTIAHVNAQTFSPGDQILFNRGDKWRETLTVPSSGTSGAHITFSAYGTGSQPIISGSDVVSSWSSPGQTAQDTFDGSEGSDNRFTSADSWFGGSFTPASSYTMTSIAAKMKIGSGSPFAHPVSAFIYNDNSGVPGTQIAAATATIQPTLTASQTYYSWNFSGVALTGGTKYWLVLNTTSGAPYASMGTYSVGGASTYVFGTNGTTWTAGFASSAAVIQTYVNPPANVWQATTSAAANQVFKNGIRATQGTSTSSLTEGQWVASGTTLYYYESAGNPGSQGYTIEASTRNDVLNWADKNYITLSGIHLTEANLYNVDFGPTGDVSGAVISGSTIDFAASSGVRSSSSAGIIGASISGNSINYNGSNGVLIQQGANSASNSVYANTLDHNCQIYAVGGVLTENQFCSAIRIGVVGSGNNVFGNTVSNTGYLPGGAVAGGSNPTGAGIWHDCGATLASGVGVISSNIVSGGSYDGIRLEDCQGEAVVRNTVYGHTNTPTNSTGIDLNSYNGFHASSGNLVYNNTLYNNYIGIQLIGSSDGKANYVVNNKVQDNIVFGSTGRAIEAEYGGENDGTMGSGNVYTYNSLGPASSNFIWWGGGFGTTYSAYSAWETAAGGCGSAGCSHSVQSDPQLNNPGSADFTLKAISPARNAGIAISGIGQQVSELIPDIGAYEYAPGKLGTLSTSQLGNRYKAVTRQ